MGIIFKNGVPYSGGGDNSKVINYEDFLKLSEEEKNSDTTYFVPDYPAGLNDPAEIVDNLESTDPNKALSANMGRELNQKIAKYQNGTVTCSYVNSTTLYGKFEHEFGENYNCIASLNYMGSNPLSDIANLSLTTVRLNNCVEFFIKGENFTAASGYWVEFLLIRN